MSLHCKLVDETKLRFEALIDELWSQKTVLPKTCQYLRWLLRAETARGTFCNEVLADGFDEVEMDGGSDLMLRRWRERVREASPVTTLWMRDLESNVLNLMLQVALEENTGQSIEGLIFER